MLHCCLFCREESKREREREFTRRRHGARWNPSRSSSSSSSCSSSVSFFLLLFRTKAVDRIRSCVARELLHGGGVRSERGATYKHSRQYAAGATNATTHFTSLHDSERTDERRLLAREEKVASSNILRCVCERV